MLSVTIKPPTITYEHASHTEQIEEFVYGCQHAFQVDDRSLGVEYQI